MRRGGETRHAAAEAAVECGLIDEVVEKRLSTDDEDEDEDEEKEK